MLTIKKNKIMIKKALLLSLMSVSALVFFTGCSEKEEEKEEEIEFLVTNPLRKDTTVTRDYVCQVHSIQHIELRALEKGYLEKIFVDEGKIVHKGQLMFKILPIQYQAELQKAEAEANFVEVEFKNTKALADSNIVSKNELALAKAKLDKAKAEVSVAKIHLGFTEVRAPFDGIMDKFQVRLGSLINEGDLLTTISDNSKMWVYFNVPEAEYLSYKAHTQQENLNRVSLLMANQQLFQYPGVVQTIEADFNNETGNIAFRATFPNPNGLLRHGETGTIQMTVPLKNALIIPQKATFEVLEKKYVYVIDKDNKIRSREITIASEMPHIFVVSAGLAATDKILLEGLRQVKENEKIKYTFAKPDSVIANLGLYAE
ncbi:efflux RND transporter periplasmic adaptor subunit [Spirosoma luteum]|uniref:efflux RND transporter periplasmic adaptor subunit n=1 Tax=Spirosoma luteum TaxID=431553 RepID=UPI0003643B02|nr:efflux RND transporter periplasmic adaptor subunit [Spirosoma luteum]